MFNDWFGEEQFILEHDQTAVQKKHRAEAEKQREIEKPLDFSLNLFSLFSDGLKLSD